MAKSIIITLMDEKKTFSYDLEVPADLDGDKLTDDIVQTIISFNPDLTYRTMNSCIYIPKINKVIESKDTLEGLGVFNGDYLIIR